MPITPLPTPPQRSDRANFAARGDAFMAALPDFADELNDFIDSGSDGVGFTQAGADVIPRSIQDKARDVVSLFDYLTASERADVRARTEAIDCTVNAQKAVTECGTTVTLVIPDGHARLNSSLVTDVGSHIIGASSAAVLVAHGAHPCITIDSTSVDVMGGSIGHLRLASTVNTIGSSGIKVIGDPVKFVSMWEFDSLRCSGVYAGIEVDKGHGPSGGFYVSFFSVNQINSLRVDEWGANESQYGLLMDGANTLTVGGSSVIRARICPIYIGDGNTGMGDLIINGVHTNYGNWAVHLWGSSDPTHYKANILVDGNQFDGGNLENVWARNLDNFTLGKNNYAVGIENNIRNCQYSRVSIKPLKSEFGVHPTGVGIGASVPLFKLSPEPSNYHVAMVEVTVTGFIAGRGMGTFRAAYSLRTEAGTLSISAPLYTPIGECGGSGTLALTVSNVSNEALFTLNQNSSAADSWFVVHAEAVGDNILFDPS